jgi:hypothetical protein
MRRDFRRYLDDILEAIHQIQSYLADQGEEIFTKDRKTQDAIIRNLEIIGEAAENCQSKYKKVSRRSSGVRLQGYATFSFMNISVSICQLYRMWFNTNSVRWKQSVEDFWREPTNRLTGTLDSITDSKISRQFAMFCNVLNFKYKC